MSSMRFLAWLIRRERRPGLQQAVVDAQIAHHVLDGRELVGGVVDHEIAREADGRRLAAQQAGAHRVERGDPRPGRSLPDERLDAGPHLVRRLVGEGDGEDLARVGQGRADQVGDPEGNDAGLSRPRAGQDEQRAVGPQDRSPLLVV